MTVPLVFCLSRHVDFPDAGLAVVNSSSILADVGVWGDDLNEGVS
jgi:hypothetical protein